MRKSVVAIGNFDGVHLGHHHLLTTAKEIAVIHDLDFSVLTFSPHPRQIFQPNIAPFRLTPDSIKKDIFTSIICPDNYVALPFNADLQHKDANQFIDDILIKKLNASYIMVGSNFHFGHKRSGNIDTLYERSEFKTIPADLYHIAGEVVTSTRIRNHLKNAEIAQANALLGWDWYIQNEVVHGDKRGRELGYPTANMHFSDTLVPSYGVYAVRVQIEGSDDWLYGAANIGIRPMFETALPMLETFIFDFEADLYGRQLKVKPVQKIRDEVKFDDLQALKDQIKADCIVAKNLLGT